MYLGFKKNDQFQSVYGVQYEILLHVQYMASIITAVVLKYIRAFVFVRLCVILQLLK